MALETKDGNNPEDRSGFLVLLQGGRKVSDDLLSIENDEFLQRHYLGNAKSFLSQKKDDKDFNFRLLPS